MNNKRRLKFEVKLYLVMLFASMLVIFDDYKDVYGYVIFFLLLVQIVFSIKNKTFWEFDLSEEQIEEIRGLLLENNTNKEIINIMNLDIDEQRIENFRTGKFDDLFDE